MRKRKKDITTEKPRSRFTKIGVAVIALALVANAVGLMNAPVDIDEAQAAVTPSYVIEETIDMPPSAADIVLDDDEDKQKQKQQVSAGSMLAYIIGWIASFCTTLLGRVLSPLAIKVLGWAVFAAAVFIAIAIALKKAFPDKSLKEILSAKNVFAILLFIAAIIAICEVLAYYFRDFILQVKLVALLLGAIGIGVAFAKIRNKVNRIIPA